MSRLKRSSVATGLLFCLAVILLFAGSIGGTQAALQQYSEIYQGEVSMKNIGVTLYENTDPEQKAEKTVEISRRNYDASQASGNWDEVTGVLIENMVRDSGDSALKIGKTYPFALSIGNTGSIDQYARVTIYKYWVTPNSDQRTNDTGWFEGKGGKLTDLDPGLIEIELANTDVWIRDTDAETPERTVLYYNGNGGILPTGASTVPFTGTLTINSEVANLVTADRDGNSTKLTYDLWNGIGFVVDVQVDAVQTHNMEQALRSAWGRTLTD